jgi:hypothetical protein
MSFLGKEYWLKIGAIKKRFIVVGLCNCPIFVHCVFIDETNIWKKFYSNDEYDIDKELFNEYCFRISIFSLKRDSCEFIKKHKLPKNYIDIDERIWIKENEEYTQSCYSKWKFITIGTNGKIIIKQ